MIELSVDAKSGFIPATSIAAALDLPRPTPEQIAIIEAPLEPILVVAGAGSGKTETMAARVLWLVINRLVGPEEVLGLTFTRKAASELGSRIRRRLSALSGSAAIPNWDPDGTLRAILRNAEPEISTYHAYAGQLITSYGLLLPVEPSHTLLGDTGMWQLASSVVSNYSGDLNTDKRFSSVTEAVINLYSDSAEHLVELDDLNHACQNLYNLIEDLPPGSGQRAKANQKLRDIKTAIEDRRALLPLVSKLREQVLEQGCLDFASQMLLAAQLVTEHPEVAATEGTSFRVVLLDEYQDTSHSQRVLLRALFGSRGNTDVAVTAVGDPIQSIYGWRGASAANLSRFALDFPQHDGKPARRLELLTSWRNPGQVLRLANAASEQLRIVGTPVSMLRAQPDAPDGAVTMALTGAAADERAWIGKQIAQLYAAADEAETPPPTTAILVRRNEDSAPMAAELESVGIPAEIVSISGLLHVPEIEDIVAMLKMINDPLAGTAAMRLLTGARWQLGAADLAALWNRAREIAGRGRVGDMPVDSGEELTNALSKSIPGELVDEVSIIDAIADPGDPERYSADGFERIRCLGTQLNQLRRGIGQPLSELVANVEQTTGVAVEAQIRAKRMRGFSTGREHLDAFAGYVSEYANNPGATLSGLLAFLDAAMEKEKGLELGRIKVSEQCVQILTIHTAKGLEWDVVVVPHLCSGIFPSGSSDKTWLTSSSQLPAELRGDLADESEIGFPRLNLTGLSDRKELETALETHKDALREHRIAEERRLLYVALTRARKQLFISAHHRPRKKDNRNKIPDFYAELASIVKGAIENSNVDSTGMKIDVDTPPPLGEDQNSLDENEVTAKWPYDRLGGRRAVTDRAAALVLDRITVHDHGPLLRTSDQYLADQDVVRWHTEVEVLLKEHERINKPSIDIPLPPQLSVSQLVELEKDEDTFARRLRRPVPFKPNPMARRGTAFHAWVESRFGATRLLDIDELPGAADESAAHGKELAELITSFESSHWATRTPVEVEIPFEVIIGSTVLRGRIDAIFSEPSGVDGEPRWIVVDWKTGPVPEPAKRKPLIVQLAAYRVAWAKLVNARLEQVRSAFHYVRSDYTLEPDDLPDETAIAAVLAKAK